MECRNIFQFNKNSHIPLMIYLAKVSAGFPSPADDYLENQIDLNDLFIKHPSATFLVRVSGNSMIDEGIHDGDILIVDRSLTPQHGTIAVVAIDGMVTVKKLHLAEGKMILMPANPEHQPIVVSEESDAVIWGVVRNVIHNLY